jgi:CelD/BcsL family acetyltransferase involved in cellulose biosynthesis
MSSADPRSRPRQTGAGAAPCSGVRLERIDPSDEDWRRLDGLPGRSLFQTRAWVDFVAASQQAEPVVAAVHADGAIAGYFSGLVVRRMGLRILGSPVPGWTTPDMGFTLTGPVSRAEAARALSRFAFHDLRCVHLEISDPGLGPDDLDGTAFERSLGQSFRADLGSDDEIFGAYSSACRRAVRKAEKVGVVVEQADGRDFADEYHEQLVGVFARQGLTPTYGVDRIRHLITHLGPTGRLLLLRARCPEGTSIATAIFPGFGHEAYFFGGASVREQQILRPNEAVFWYAMRWWRDRGVTTFDFGGGGDYKLRYGGTPVTTVAFHLSRVPWLSTVRPVVRSLAAQRRRVRALLATRRTELSPQDTGRPPTEAAH